MQIQTMGKIETGAAASICDMPVGDRLKTAVERRKEPRLPATGCAVVRSLCPLEQVRFRARVLDISRTGLRFRTRCRYSHGTTVHVFLKAMMIIGEVRYCTGSGDGFEHGVSIEQCLGGPELSGFDPAVHCLVNGIN